MERIATAVRARYAVPLEAERESLPDSVLTPWHAENPKA
jgi:hypothetical protein